MSVVNLHSEGMAYSPGGKDSRVVLLFESPGKNEVMLNSPLSGLTGTRYCQIVKTLMKREETCSANSAKWFDFCKCNATIINAYPFYSHISADKKVVYATSDECLVSIATCIQMCRRDVLISFGKVACCVINELIKRKLIEQERPMTIIKLWHLSSRNNYFDVPESSVEKDSSIDSKWQQQLTYIAEYIQSRVSHKGIFGWESIRKAIPGCLWNGSACGPDWLSEKQTAKEKVKKGKKK